MANLATDTITISAKTDSLETGLLRANSALNLTAQHAASLGAAFAQLSTATATVGNQLSGLASHGTTATAGLQATGAAASASAQQVASLGQAAGSSTGSVAGLGGALGGVTSILGAMGIGLSIAGLVTLAKQAYATAVAWDSLQTSIRVATGSLSEGNAVMAQIKATAMAAGVSVESLGAGYLALSSSGRAAGLSNTQIQQAFLGSQQAAKAMGGGIDTAKELMTAFGTAMKHEIVTFDSLRKAFSGFPEILERIAAAYNTNAAGLASMLASGTVHADEFFPKIFSQFSKLASTGEDATARVGTALDKLGATWMNVLDKIGRSETFKAFTEGATKIGEFLGGGLPPTKVPDATVTLPGVQQWQYLIDRATAGTKVPPELVRSIMAAESGGNQIATSDKGAAGLMQIMPKTWADLDMPAGKQYDPRLNIEAGVKLLDQLLTTFHGDISKTIAAYNAGPGHGGIPLPGENTAFVAKVQANLAIDRLTNPTAADKALEAKTAAESLATTASKHYAETLLEIARQLKAYDTQARLAPDLKGGPKSTDPDLLKTYLTGRSNLLDKGVSDLSEQLSGHPGVAVDPGVTKRFEALKAEATATRDSLTNLNTAQEAAKKDAADTLALYRAMEAEKDAAAGHIGELALIEAQQNEAAIVALRELAQKYTYTAAARDVDTASKLKAKLAGDELLHTEAEGLVKQVEIGETFDKLKKREEALGEIRYQHRIKAQAEIARQEELLGLTPEGTKIPASARAYTKLERATWAEDLIPEDRKRRDAVLREQTPQMMKVKNAGEEISAEVLSVFDRIASGSKISLNTVLQEFEHLFFKILMDMSGAKEGLAGLGTSLLTKLVGLLPGATPTASPGGPAETAPAIQASPPMGMAAGGTTAMPGGFYRVGEHGEETLRLPGGSRVYAHGEGPGGSAPITVNISVHGVTDLSSFKRSDGEIGQKAVAALRRHQGRNT